MRLAFTLLPALALAGCVTAPRAGLEHALPGRHAAAAPATDPALPIADNLARVPSLATTARLTQAAAIGADMAGPVTLFAPTDAAWGRLAPGNLDALALPQNRPTLAKLLRYHCVAGRWTAAMLRERVAAAGGRTALPTLAGDLLKVTLTGSVLTLTDAAGDRSYLVAADLPAADGLIQIVNGVVLPHLEG